MLARVFICPNGLGISLNVAERSQLRCQSRIVEDAASKFFSSCTLGGCRAAIRITGFGFFLVVFPLLFCPAHRAVSAALR